LVGDGELAAGWAADDGAALVFAGDQVSEVVASRRGANAYRVEKTSDGTNERCVPSRCLGA
jgi:dipeptidase E